MLNIRPKKGENGALNLVPHQPGAAKGLSAKGSFPNPKREKFEMGQTKFKKSQLPRM